MPTMTEPVEAVQGKARGAEVVSEADGRLLVRVAYTHDGAEDACLRIVVPTTIRERLLFQRGRLRSVALRRAVVVAYLLLPVLLLLNTAVAQVGAVPYALVVASSALLLAVDVVGWLWFFWGSALVDRLLVDPVNAMRAPAVPVPSWWGDRAEGVSAEMVGAFQRAYLARAVAVERIREGEALQWRLTPSQPSFAALREGLWHLERGARVLGGLLVKESVSAEHARALVEAAEGVGVPGSVVEGPVAEEVRVWAAGE